VESVFPCKTEVRVEKLAQCVKSSSTRSKGQYLQNIESVTERQRHTPGVMRSDATPQVMISVTSNDEHHVSKTSEENTFTIKMSDANEKERRLLKKLE